jgi:O-antigen ligase
VGWAGYGAAYEQTALRHGVAPGAPGTRTVNPHNEYLLQFGAGGLPALALFIAWLATAARCGLRADGAGSPHGRLAVGLTLAFACACLFNSMLLDFSAGHFHVALLAWLLAANRHAPAGPPRPP